MADPSASAPTAQTAAPTTVTAPAATQPSQTDAAASADDAGPGTPVNSPDVAEWTAQFVHEQQAAAEKQSAHSVRHGLGKFASRILARTTTIAKSLTRDALRFLGTPYVFGGRARRALTARATYSTSSPCSE